MIKRAAEIFLLFLVVRIGSGHLLLYRNAVFSSEVVDEGPLSADDCFILPCLSEEQTYI
jgi:hypothetical protein